MNTKTAARSSLESLQQIAELTERRDEIDNDLVEAARAIHRSSGVSRLMASALTNNDQWRHSVIMTRAMDPEVFDAIWAAIEPILPKPDRSHPLGCHNPRIGHKVCFRGLMIRLVTGASWVDVEALLNHQVSDTTLRGRRNEWITAGVFDQLCDQALAAFDRILELDLDNVAIDGSLHKAPCGGEGTGPNPTDRGKCGHKWSLAVDGHGIPIGWALDGANRNDVAMLEPTIDAVAPHGLLDDIDTLHLDRGYDYPKIRKLCHGLGLTELDRVVGQGGP